MRAQEEPTEEGDEEPRGGVHPPMDARRSSRPGRGARSRTTVVSSHRFPAAAMWRGHGVQPSAPCAGDLARPWRPAVGSLWRRCGAAVASSRRLPAATMWCRGRSDQHIQVIVSVDGCAPTGVREWWLACSVGEAGEREERSWQQGGRLPRRMHVPALVRASTSSADLEEDGDRRHTTTYSGDTSLFVVVNCGDGIFAAGIDCDDGFFAAGIDCGDEFFAKV